jgi:hypothetical protein
LQLRGKHSGTWAATILTWMSGVERTWRCHSGKLSTRTIIVGAYTDVADFLGPFFTNLMSEQIFMLAEPVIVLYPDRGNQNLITMISLINAIFLLKLDNRFNTGIRFYWYRTSWCKCWLYSVVVCFALMNP